MSREIIIILLVVITLATLASSVRNFCSANGRRYEVGKKWKQKNYKCRCVYPESSLYFWDGTNPSDAVPSCQPRGCPRNPWSRRVVKAGRTFFYGPKWDRCICRRGNSLHPISDAPAPLFHGECSDQWGTYYVTFR